MAGSLRPTVSPTRGEPGITTLLLLTGELSQESSEPWRLVEDDSTVRGLTGRMLREIGYTVLEAGNAAEARQRAEQRDGRIDLLLTDVVMPGGSGRELADALTARYPGLAVLFMSGYTADVVLRQGLVQEAVAFLPKPFTDTALAEAVRQVLDSPAPEG